MENKLGIDYEHSVRDSSDWNQSVQTNQMLDGYGDAQSNSDHKASFLTIDRARSVSKQ